MPGGTVADPLTTVPILLRELFSQRAKVVRLPDAGVTAKASAFALQPVAPSGIEVELTELSPEGGGPKLRVGETA
jgi:hypothetical protein